MQSTLPPPHCRAGVPPRARHTAGDARRRDNKHEARTQHLPQAVFVFLCVRAVLHQLLHFLQRQGLRRVGTSYFSSRAIELPDHLAPPCHAVPLPLLHRVAM